jgi:hypothetical protein
MSDSIFNPDALLDTNYEEAPPDHYIPIDEGEYRLRVRDVKPRRITNAGGEAFTLAEVNFIVLDDAVKEKMNMPEPMARMTIFLDLTPDGTLDMGVNKNVKIGQLRNACGIRDGKRWSLRDLWDRECWGKIRQRQAA